MSAPLSRPKIHRRPPTISRAPKKTPGFNIYLTTVATAALALALIGRLLPGDMDSQTVEATPELMPISSAMAAPGQREGSIVIRGSNGTIVGQMAKIPVQNQPITEITSVSNVDNGTQRDLLSIVNKY